LQMQLLDLLQESPYVVRNIDMEFEIDKLYKGNKNALGTALNNIGVELFRKRIDGVRQQAYRINNQKRFDSIIAQFE
ncbi:MAG: phage resistance protein, partial [Streptococcus sp.]